MTRSEREEAELLAAFREMNEEQKRALLDYGSFLQSRDEYRKKYKVEGREGNVIRIKRT